MHRIYRLASALTVAYSNTGDCNVIATAVSLLVLHALVCITATSGITEHPASAVASEICIYNSDTQVLA